MNIKVSKWLLWCIARIRKNWTVQNIRRESKQDSCLDAFSFGTTKMLKIIPLYEALSDNELKSGFGVSYLIRTDKSTILFDLGNNPKDLSPSPLEENMSKLGISLDTIDFLFISHRHPDHVGGMKWWRKKSFSLNGMTQRNLDSMPVYVPEKLFYPNTITQLIKEPSALAEGIASTGRFSFFEPYPLWQIVPKDYEHAMAINVEGKGIVLIVGCGHMGLNLLLKRAKATFNQPVIGIIGGLHYGKSKETDLQSDIQALRTLQLQIVGLSPHDSYPEALGVVEKAFPEIYRTIHVGNCIEC